MNVNFSHMIFVRSDDRAAIVELLEQWDRQQASADIMGYMGARLLADRENPGQYIIVADFGVVDPDVSAADEATRNDVREMVGVFYGKLFRQAVQIYYFHMLEARSLVV